MVGVISSPPTEWFYDLKIMGMICADSCAERCKRAIMTVAGVAIAEVDFQTGSARIFFNPAGCNGRPIAADETTVGPVDMLTLALAVEYVGYTAIWGVYSLRVNVLKIDGMTCGHCTATVQKAAEATKVAFLCRVSLDKHECYVITGRTANLNHIADAVQAVGYLATPVRCHREVSLQIVEWAPRDSRRVYSALRATPGVVCAQLSNTSSYTAQIITRGSASVQDIVLLLKGLGYRASVSEYTHNQLAAPGSLPDVPRSHAGKSTIYSSIDRPDLGYIADMKSIFAVRGMTYFACVAAVEDALGRVAGVKHVSVALLTETAEVLYDGKLINWRTLLSVFHDAGYSGTHVYTTNTGAVQYSRRLFAIDMEGGSIQQSAFNCASIIAHTVGLISLNWVTDGSLGADKYEGGPITSSPKDTSPVEPSVVVRSSHSTSASIAAYSNLERRHSFSGTPPNVFSCLPMDISVNPLSAPVDVFEATDFSTIRSTEVVLQAVYDAQLVGLRTILDNMVTLNPHFAARVLPEKDFRVDTLLDQRKEREALRELCVVALVLSTPIAAMMWGHLFMQYVRPGITLCDVISSALATAVVLHCGRIFFEDAHRDLRTGSVGMSFLASLGAGSLYLFGIYALACGYMREQDQGNYSDSSSSESFMTSAIFVMFALLGKTLEAETMAKASFAVDALIKQQAGSAVILSIDAAAKPFLNKNNNEGGGYTVEMELTVDAALLQRGDIVKVTRGMIFPADGKVIYGSGEADEAVITGEAIPIPKSIGDRIIGGSLLTEGMIHVRITETLEKSILQQIICLVEKAQLRKDPCQQKADGMAGRFALGITAFSILIFVIWIALLIFGSYRMKHVLSEYFDQKSVLTTAFTFAATTLTVACPCAIGLVNPIAIMIGTGVGARHGLMIKGGDVLETAHKVTAVVFNKTGTLTLATPVVKRVVHFNSGGDADAIPPSNHRFGNLSRPNSLSSVFSPSEPRTRSDSFSRSAPTDSSHALPVPSSVDTLGIESAGAMNCDTHSAAGIIYSTDLNEMCPDRNTPLNDLGSGSGALPIESQRMLWYAACAELKSEHILGQAIVRYATHVASMPSLQEPKDVAVTAGKGMTCRVAGHGVIIGTLDFIRDYRVEESLHSSLAQYSIESSNEGCTTVYVALDGVLQGLIEFFDPPRPEAEATVAALHGIGVDVWMVTGDNDSTAQNIGRQVGILPHKIISHALPSTKIKHVKHLQSGGGIVAFIGDGINDAPALTQANVGIAMPEAAIVAIESADVVLMHNDLFHVMTVVDLSKTVMRCVQRNIFWAVAYNIAALPVASGMFVTVVKGVLPPYVTGFIMALSSVSVLISSLALCLYSPPQRKTTAEYLSPSSVRGFCSPGDGWTASSALDETMPLLGSQRNGSRRTSKSGILMAVSNEASGMSVEYIDPVEKMFGGHADSRSDSPHELEYEESPVGNNIFCAKKQKQNFYGAVEVGGELCDVSGRGMNEEDRFLYGDSAFDDV